MLETGILLQTSKKSYKTPVFFSEGSPTSTALLDGMAEWQTGLVERHMQGTLDTPLQWVSLLCTRSAFRESLVLIFLTPNFKSIAITFSI